jgi:hypothetical protein
MSELCQVTPISAFMSTNLSSKINCFQELGARILRMLGHPMVNVELHPDQLYDSISMACEFFTQYAGYTKEYIIFDSNLYEPNKGIRLDHLFTVANTGFTLSEKLNEPTKSNPDYNINLRENLYILTSAIPSAYFVSSSALSSSIPSTGLPAMQIMEESTYAQLTAFDPGLSDLFMISTKKPFTIQCNEVENVIKYNNMFDYDVMDYRKVIDVVDFIEGSSSGVNTLFSMEQTMAQQTYYSYAMGNFGFDLLSWHTVKDWQDTREKLLAIKRDIHFDKRSQYLRLMPQPKSNRFYGVLECYVERPLKDIVKEKWVFEYATALCKVMWGRILTKVSGVQLLGGGTLDGSTILQEGIQSKAELETFLIEGGFGDMDPPMMFVG